jgi:hypothetical protein
MGGTVEPLSPKAANPYAYGGASSVYEVALSGDTLTMRSLPVSTPHRVVIVAERLKTGE